MKTAPFIIGVNYLRKELVTNNEDVILVPAKIISEIPSHLKLYEHQAFKSGLISNVRTIILQLMFDYLKTTQDSLAL